LLNSAAEQLKLTGFAGFEGAAGPAHLY